MSHVGGVEPIVVAFDGSPESVAGLRWARNQATRTGAPIRIVTAFHVRTPQGDHAGAYADEFQAAEHAAWTRAHTAIAGSDMADLARVEHIVAAGPIDDVLLAHSKDAASVVVGTRSTDGWSARFRGSLTNRLTGRLRCPVVSVPLDVSPKERVAV